MERGLRRPFNDGFGHFLTKSGIHAINEEKVTWVMCYIRKYNNMVKLDKGTD